MNTFFPLLLFPKQHSIRTSDRAFTVSGTVSSLRMNWSITEKWCVWCKNTIRRGVRHMRLLLRIDWLEWEVGAGVSPPLTDVWLYIRLWQTLKVLGIFHPSNKGRQTFEEYPPSSIFKKVQYLKKENSWWLWKFLVAKHLGMLVLMVILELNSLEPHWLMIRSQLPLGKLLCLLGICKMEKWVVC